MRARIHFLRGNLHFPRGNIEGCLADHRKSLELARETESPELEAQAFGGLGDADYARGRMISAHRQLERCVELASLHGLGRIKVANRSQMAHAALYFRPVREALGEGLAAASAAAEVGHLRAEINARVANVFALITMVDLNRLRAEVGLVLDLVQRLGARRFLQSSLPYLGKAALLEGNRPEAVRILRETLEVAHQTGITFSGPAILGPLALALNDLSEQRQMLAQGEALMRKGCVAHNQLRFYPDAIDVALELGDWDEAERYAAALEDFAHGEPLPWSDFFVARGRALAAFGRGCVDESTKAELERLAAEARRLGYRIALPALERALARL
jgi:tetratricopeptide (TPR) repeat protein